MKLKLSNYTELIKQLPYEKITYDETRKETWENFAVDASFSKFFNKAFAKEESVRYSREELFIKARNDVEEGIFSIVLWGYPSGYTRANTMARLFPWLLESLASLKNLLGNKNSIDFSDMKKFPKVKGVGLSTFSKFLYFFNFKIGNSKCLILDSKIIKVLQTNEFEELENLKIITDHNKLECYPIYVETMNLIAKANGYEPDQLELFLFMFGRNLKEYSQ